MAKKKLAKLANQKGAKKNAAKIDQINTIDQTYPAAT
jgi:hypothetical protein